MPTRSFGKLDGLVVQSIGALGLLLADPAFADDVVSYSAEKVCKGLMKALYPDVGSGIGEEFLVARYFERLRHPLLPPGRHLQERSRHRLLPASGILPGPSV